MIVCDRHHRTKAVGKVVITREDEHYDLCAECLFQIKEFIADPKRDSVESKPKKGIFRKSA